MTQTEILSFLREGALYRRPGGGLALFWGPFARSSSDANVDVGWQDFFETCPREFKSAKAEFMFSEEALQQELRNWLETHQGETLARSCFEEPQLESYKVSFDKILGLIKAGEVKKALPVVFARAKGFTPSIYQRALSLLELLRAPRTVHVYGFWTNEWGMLGASPEILFRQKGQWLETVAVAGTLPKADVSIRKPLLDDPKEMSEHQFVADDLEQVLAPLGKVKKGETRLAELPTMFHLITPLEVELAEAGGIARGPRKWAELLHPTPALGVFPRSYGFQWLSELPEQKARGAFGAPLIFRLGPDEMVAVVAIRSLIWDKGGSRVGSGGGLVAASQIDQEWRELSQKRESVFKSLGIK
jgi:menaquinone-specific isochorismate synthase